MKRIPYFHYITLAVICQVVTALFLGSTPASASANNFYFSDYTADYYLEATDDGSKLKVSEQLTAEFPSYDQNHGIERAIPYTNQGGVNLTAPTIGSLNFTATRNGQPENIADTTTENDYYIFRLGDPDSYLHGTQKYQLEYEFTNVVTNQSRATTSQPHCIQAPCPEETTTLKFQELYWDTNGTEWSQKFDRVTANFHLDDDLIYTLQDNTWCYVGAQYDNNQSRCTTTKTDDGFTFTATNLKPGENLTFVVNFNAGTFAVPAPRGNYLLVILTGISTAIFLAALVIFSIRYCKHIRQGYQYYKHLFTPPQYAPHPGHTVADAATIYLKTTKSAQVPTLLELAVSHKIELIKTNETWQIKIKDLTNLTPAQTAVLQILKGADQLIAGEQFTIQKQQYSSTSAAHSLTFHTATSESLQNQGYLTPKTPRTFLLVLCVIAEFVLTFVGLLNFDAPGIVYKGLIFALAALTFASAMLAVIYSILSNKYAARTQKGLDLSNYYQGLKDYIQLAEADRLKLLQSVEGADTTAEGIVKLYEKVLPYAALFGLEKSWLAELNKYYTANPDLSPDWCTGAAIGYLSVNDFDSFSSAADNSYSSASSTSDSGSGSDGGGFSGGGGGGGGGGGW